MYTPNVKTWSDSELVISMVTLNHNIDRWDMTLAEEYTRLASSAKTKIHILTEL